MERSVCSAKVLSVASRCSHAQFRHRSMASIDWESSLLLWFGPFEELIFNAAVKMPLAISLFPRDHSIMAYALYRRRLEGCCFRRPLATFLMVDGEW